MEIRGVTRGALERRLGMSKGHVSRIIERGNMEIGTFQQIADALDVSYEWLLNGPPALFERTAAPARAPSELDVARAARELRSMNLPAELEGVAAEPIATPAPSTHPRPKRAR